MKFRYKPKSLEKRTRQPDKHMPVKTIGGFPCRHGGFSFVEVNTDCGYYRVDFGVVLIEAVTNYICKNCKNILV